MDATSPSNLRRNAQVAGNSASGWNDYQLDSQAQTSYGYARDNPSRYKDTDGLWFKEFLGERPHAFGNRQSWSSFQLELGEASEQLAQDSTILGYSFDHPIKTGVVIGVASGGAAASAAGGIVLSTLQMSERD